ncbi:MAG: AMP-binding protein [bacterium]|nr:AMP-binding protein [bacterium]
MAERCGREPRVPQGSQEVDNGPSTIVSGTKDGVVLFEKKMKKRKLLSVRLPATRAMHSSQMEPAAGALLKEVSTVTLNKPGIPLMSNVTGKWLTAEEAADPAYWSRQLRETVQFAGGIRTLLKKSGKTIFIEVGPGSELTVLLRYFIEEGQNVKVLTTLRNPRKKVRDVELVKKTLSKLRDSGVPVDPDSIARGKRTGKEAVAFCEDTPGLSPLFVSRGGISLFIKWIQAARISHLWTTPQLFHGMVAAGLDTGNTSFLRQLIIYGAGVKPGTVKKWFAAANPDLKVAGLYGMPEFAGCKFCYFIGRDDEKKSFIPVGKPIKGVRAVILDKNLKISEPGLFGDLFIRTPYLSAGYEGNEPLTRSRFIPNPLGNNPGEMIFRTGEKAKLMKSGDIQLQLPETEKNLMWEPVKDRLPPTNETEEKLVRIWQGILKWDDVGIEDDYFEGMGHSLGIMRMASEIYETFGVEMSIQQLFAKTTVKQIADYLISVQGSAGGSTAVSLYEDAPYIVFNETGGRNIFLFPPKIAFGLEYKGLSQLLPSCRFYAFNFIGTGEEAGTNDVVENYRRMVEEIQPDGSYVFLGHSAGGNLAFEVAKAMESTAKKSVELMVIDSFTDREVEGLADPGTLQNYIDFVAKNMDSGGLSFYKKKVLNKITKYSAFMNSLETMGQVKANIHFIAAENRKVADDWNSFTENVFKLYNGSGEHAQMLNPGHLEKNSLVIKKILSQI